jgi:hypothetical protein
MAVLYQLSYPGARADSRRRARARPGTLAAVIGWPMGGAGFEPA